MWLSGAKSGPGVQGASRSRWWSVFTGSWAAPGLLPAVVALALPTPVTGPSFLPGMSGVGVGQVGAVLGACLVQEPSAR